MNKLNKARLVELEKAQIRLKFPSLPEHCFPKSNYSDKDANSLTKCIVDFINLSGYQAERINTMGVYREAKKHEQFDGNFKTLVKGTYTPSTSTKGSADISSTIYGRSVKIEVKYGKDRMSESQQRYKEDIEKAGGVYFVARTFDEFLEFYDAFIEKVTI
jgi:hypothetical protein